ncbi:peptidoglycan-binding domain-containing protein [Sphingobium sp.]|uniref:peptidoglycan-binding domain-containing protein n=1 Tax=Sphingobium sp. TaxID=1912891 RepID=UPI003BB5D6A8
MNRAISAAADSKVETIQKLLSRLGYQPGPATGLMNPKTQFAIMKFEETAGLPIKGEASSAILDALLSEITG